MRRSRSGALEHDFHNKLLLNKWLISLFGIDPFKDYHLHGKRVQPFHLLADSIKDRKLEGLDHDNLHHFYKVLMSSNLILNNLCTLSREQILLYEENIVRHTLAINKRRRRPVVWKYFQWFTLLFVEIYLDQFFSNSEKLQNDLNANSLIVSTVVGTNTKIYRSTVRMN